MTRHDSPFSSSRICILLVALAIFPMPGLAISITTTASYNIDGSPLTDSDSAASGTLTSLVESTNPFTTSDIEFSGPGYARASQNDAGFGAVVADALFASGGNSTNSMTATATWSDTATNTSGSDKDYDFTFLITPPQLTIADFAGASSGSPGAPNASYNVSILRDGLEIFDASATLAGGSGGHTLTTSGADLGGVFFGDGSVFGYDFDSYADTLSLGSLSPGASLTLEYIMTVSISADPFELGARAAIGDPFDLNGTGSGAGVPGGGISQVPVPGALPMFLSGFGLLWMAARRRL